MALGAEPLWVLRMILGQGLVLIGAGLAIGTLAAFALTRFMGGILYGVSATDPVTFLGTLAVLMLVGVVACFVPARRATASDPMLVLRS
jgi:ABC-type antimicrobial peptide transport system permease subunit